MAVKSVVDKVILRLRFEEMTEDGKEKISSRSYNNVKSDIEDQAIYNTGKIISSLQEKPVESISKVATTVFEEME